MEIKRWVLYLTPQSQVLVVFGGRWVLGEKITDAYLVKYGAEKKAKAILDYNKGKRKSIPSANYYKNRRKSLKGYYDYKMALRAEAARQKFVVPSQGMYIRFFLPMPKSWSQKKKNAKCFELHENKSDMDNLLKAFFDSLVPKDQVISDYRASKFWIDGGAGHIEITLGELAPAIGYTPFKYKDNIK